MPKDVKDILTTPLYVEWWVQTSKRKHIYPCIDVYVPYEARVEDGNGAPRQKTYTCAGAFVVMLRDGGPFTRYGRWDEHPRLAAVLELMGYETSHNYFKYQNITEEELQALIDKPLVRRLSRLKQLIL